MAVLIEPRQQFTRRFYRTMRPERIEDSHSERCSTVFFVFRAILQIVIFRNDPQTPFFDMIFCYNCFLIQYSHDVDRLFNG